MNGNKKPTKITEEANVVSWVLTGLLLAVDAFPLGLFFLIAKLSGHDILGRLPQLCHARQQAILHPPYR